jgi:hypothetical protein
MLKTTQPNLMMANAMSAELLDNFQHSTQLISKS